MTASVTFSIVIPCYNRASEVMPTLESVRAQTFADFECIVVDDGSKDSEALRGNITRLADSRFLYIHQANQGGGAARNAGIRAARGRYIAFLDSDDIFLPRKLEVVNARMDESGVPAIYSRAYVDRGLEGRRWIKPDRAIRRDEDMGEYLFVANQVVQTSTIVMTAAKARSVMFDPCLRKGQDLDFCVRAHAAGIRFSMIDDPLIVWIDATEQGRTSRHAGAKGLLEWSGRNKQYLTRNAALGFRASVVAVFRPKWQLPVVIWDLAIAWLVAGVPASVVLRQFIRFAIPRQAYRWLVDTYVQLRGAKTEKPNNSHIV